jgi:hypothetical protein
MVSAATARSDGHPAGWSATLAFARLMRLGVEVGEPAVGAQPGLVARNEYPAPLLKRGRIANRPSAACCPYRYPVIQGGLVA